MRQARVLIVLLAALLTATAAAGQQQKPKPRFAASCEPNAKRHVPYSAQFALSNVSPEPDGNIAAYNYSEGQALDSHGRFLETTTSPDPNHKGPPQTTASVCDPETNTQFQWDSLRKHLVVLKMPRPEERIGCWESEQGDYVINFDAARRLSADAEARASRIDEYARDPNNASPLVEDLGTRMLQGVEVHGTRTTYPPAKSSTEPEPPYVMEEHWKSPLLGLWLEQEVDYPASRAHNIKWSRKLANLNLNEPEPSTFDPPAGYTIVAEAMRRVPCEDPVEQKVRASSPATR
jgi:hypothetical protein